MILEESDASQIIAAITKGIMHCHTNGVIHHDLKLENILIKTNQNRVINRVKIADFGLSRLITDKLEAGPDSRGTLEYVAPEMLV